VLKDKIILLGITGSIAAYKAAELASRLTQAGARVNVAMSEAATRLISPITFRALTGRSVATSLWDNYFEHNLGHISLAESADIVVIAPATANTIAKLAAGIADDIISCSVLVTKAPVIIAPAMNVNMLRNPITQSNISRLKAIGFKIVEPSRGRLASGAIGEGRLADAETITDIIKTTLNRRKDLAGKHIVITAGGTEEPIDPARHIGNRATGKMGYALAEAARDRGAMVSLITAPTLLTRPLDIAITEVRTASEMKMAVNRLVKKADGLIMAAAVSDYKPEKASEVKIKKESHPRMTLELIRTPDILGQLKGDFMRVGFAAESDNIIANARKKLIEKHLDIIITNDITSTGSGFGVDTNRVTILDRGGNEETLPILSKREVADRILDRVVKLI
jgi:phosphopantothenoylcysteine decarboxylase/phosphopantothenate--cysteine ligase